MNRIRVLTRSSLAVFLAAMTYSLPMHAQTVESVTYLLPAPATLPAFIPWVLAQQRNYYRNEGLEIKFMVAKGGVDVAKQVGAGNAPIGGAIGDTPIIARAQAIPVKAVAVLGGGSLTNLVIHDGTGIEGPRDLKGKTVTVLSYQDTTFYALLGMLASAGLTRHDVNIQAAGPVGIWQQFASGKAVAFAGPVDWAVNAKHAGAKIKILAAGNYTQSMAQAILASDEIIEKRPELVRKLVRATLRGLEDILKQGNAIIPDYVAGAPSFKGKEAFLEEVVALFTQYTYRGQRVLGAMDPERLAAVQKFYVKEGIVPKETPLGELYTNQFVK